LPASLGSSSAAIATAIWSLADLIVSRAEEIRLKSTAAPTAAIIGMSASVKMTAVAPLRSLNARLKIIGSSEPTSVRHEILN
jgi:hypothetical protein